MSNEDTRIINEDTRFINEHVSENMYDDVKDNSSLNHNSNSAYAQKNSGKGKTVAAAAGGFVAGAAVGGATMAAAQQPDETIIPEEVSKPEDAANNGEAEAKTEEAAVTAETTAEGAVQNETPSVTPNPEQVILANDEGVRYAHVTADNFNDAFAQARAQVGAGGVFEYNGKLYGTYYADEWNEMSSSERAAYQSRVSGVAPTHHHDQPAHSANAYDMADNSHAHDAAPHANTHHAPEVIPTNAEMIDVEPVDNEIRVIGVDSFQDSNGQIMNVALLEADGDRALLVDVNNDGVMDVVIHDDNGSGDIQLEEMHDISGAGIELTDLMLSQADYSSEGLYVANDDMPDYYNDADMTMNV